jgi:hypothetical protein
VHFPPTSARHWPAAFVPDAFEQLKPAPHDDCAQQKPFTHVPVAQSLVAEHAWPIGVLHAPLPLHWPPPAQGVTGSAEPADSSVHVPSVLGAEQVWHCPQLVSQQVPPMQCWTPSVPLSQSASTLQLPPRTYSSFVSPQKWPGPEKASQLGLKPCASTTRPRLVSNARCAPSRHIDGETPPVSWSHVIVPRSNSQVSQRSKLPL